jgi:Protein of unknown function (DUF3617)
MKTHLVATATAAALLAGAAWADKGAKPNMDVALGLWEVTSQGEISGAPPVPDSVLARLTPEQQARLQEMMGKGAQPKKYKSCMTPDKLDQGFEKDAGAEAASQCTTTVSTNTSSEYQAEKQCKTDGGMSYDAKIHFSLAGRHQARGTVDVLITQATGKATTMHHKIDAQWLGADCGTIKDVEMEP